MIDPSIADLMNHLDRPVPALVREARQSEGVNARMRRYGEATRQAVEEFEAECAAWIEGAERRAHLIVRAGVTGTLSDEDRAGLRGVVEGIEDAIEREARTFAREQKWGRRAVKLLRQGSPAEGRLAALLIRRYLAALAGRGVALAELMFVVRSVLAEAEPAGPPGPVFDDPKTLGDYLRGAIA